MKRTLIPAAVLLVLLFTFCFAACALAADIRPIPLDHDNIDLANGEFCLNIKNADRVNNGGYFVAALTLKDHYDAEQIRALVPGDTVMVNDRTWTVEKLIDHGENTYEVYTEEELDGYLAFWPQEDGTFIAVINDWVPVTPVGAFQVRLPLPDAFEYIRIAAGEEQAPEGADAFTEDLGEYPDSFNAYNTTCVFEGGALIRVTHSSYPEGPEDFGEEGPVPFWTFFHGLRDGLDTAVITAYIYDCEEGPLPAEITPEEAEQIRRLALNGRVTDKVSDEMTTGNYWIYSFETPGGKNLLSIAMYKGLLIGSDGLYGYQE